MNEELIMAGSSITSKDDILKKTTIDYVANSIKNPKPEMLARFSLLRMVRSIDAKQYASLKRDLPYLVCGVFNPPYRRTENFAYIQYFFIDIDHISEKDFTIESIKNEIINDSQVIMCFISPSEDGVKVLFRLSERCYDAAVFTIFYKIFARDFSVRHNITQVIDSRTCDVARACFISVDPDIFYNPSAESIDMSAYMNSEDTYSLIQIMKEQKSNESSEDDTNKIEIEKNEKEAHDPDAEVMHRIKSILNPSAKKKNERNPVFVPEQLNELIADLKRYIEETGLVIYDIINIQYGKKIKCKTNFRNAEVNLFYGKKGFSVVTSPRSGTSSELNLLLKELITTYVNKQFV